MSKFAKKLLRYIDAYVKEQRDQDREKSVTERVAEELQELEDYKVRYKAMLEGLRAAKTYIRALERGQDQELIARLREQYGEAYARAKEVSGGKNES